MNSYTIETVLETREPGVIELFGNAPGVVHKVSGVLHLHVDKTIHLKELFVVFLCEAVVGYRSTVVSTSSDPMTIYRNQFDVIPLPSATPMEYAPGDYKFPFQLAIPSDLSTTDSTKLISQEFIWMYHLTTTAIPANLTKGSTITSLFQKRKTIQMPLILRKCVVEQSGGNTVRCNARRAGEKEGDEFKAVIFVPQVVNVKQTIVPVTVQMKGTGGGKSRRWRVKEIQAQMIQTEKVVHNSPEAYHSMEGLRRMIPIGIQDDPMAPKKYKKPTYHSSPHSSNTSSLFHSMLGDRSQQLHHNNQPQLQHQSSNANTATSTTSASTNINASASVGSMVNTTHTKTISNLVSIKDPNQYVEGVHSPGQSYSQTFELDLTAGEKVVNASGILSEVLPSEVLPWVTVSHAIRFRVLFEDAGGEKPLVVKAPVQIAYVLGRESINLTSGQPILQPHEENTSGVDDWMYADSAPDYEYSPDGGNGGREGGEDVLPGYGEDVGRSNLLDSNLRSNQQYGLSVK
ncbi:hypothetical protein BG015_008760 [Linnemannia schmuckeri]|uniref:LDB19 N-terminal domain-containing protein n=1 Tax=Linnemannia schmuckeri TaxID=64567 RepID=A0A9P5S031_9FUNG|nr:hypothetical protein BG015_008760 [Linnemannia schmuckeri]